MRKETLVWTRGVGRNYFGWAGATLEGPPLPQQQDLLKVKENKHCLVHLFFSGDAVAGENALAKLTVRTRPIGFHKKRLSHQLAAFRAAARHHRGRDSLSKSLQSLRCVIPGGRSCGTWANERPCTNLRLMAVPVFTVTSEVKWLPAAPPSAAAADIQA